MNPVLDPERLRRRTPDRRWRAGVIVAAFVAVVALPLVGRSLQGPSFVDELTVVNRSPFDLHVVVRGEEGGALGLGTVRRDGSTTFTSVLDQGDTWSFTFTAGGEDGGTLEVARAALEDEDWVMTVPAPVGRQLERAGLPPSPATRSPEP